MNIAILQKVKIAFRNPSVFYVIVLFFVLALLPFKASGQSTELEVQSAVYAGTAGELPFWLHANRLGKVDPASANWINQLGLTHTFLENDRFLIQGGGNGVLRWSEHSSAFFSELYLRARGYGFQLDAGRFDQPIGLNNHDLSIGSMMVSRNATPVPKVSLSTPEFLNVPLTNGHLQFKGMFSHGWLEEDRFVESPYLHQKYLYLRVNAGAWSATGGIVHNAQWGGEHPRMGRLPQGWEDYLRLISGMAAAEGSGAPGGDVVNVIGNSVAAYDFGLGYEHEQFTASLTRMFYLEDKVSTRFRSPWDGVWGFNIRFKEQPRWLQALTYEHINTKNQDAKSWELIGRRDYYDNYLYQSGWTYEGRVLGLPLITFNGSTITNNVLVGHHLGLQGCLTQQWSYRTLFTYSRNYGVQNDWVEDPAPSIPEDREDITPLEQFREDRFSWLLDMRYKVGAVPGLQLQLQLASDFGSFYEDHLGISVGVQWRLSR